MCGSRRGELDRCPTPLKRQNDFNLHFNSYVCVDEAGHAETVRMGEKHVSAEAWPAAVEKCSSLVALVALVVLYLGSLVAL